MLCLVVVKQTLSKFHLHHFGLHCLEFTKVLYDDKNVMSTLESVAYVCSQVWNAHIKVSSPRALSSAISRSTYAKNGDECCCRSQRLHDSYSWMSSLLLHVHGFVVKCCGGSHVQSCSLVTLKLLVALQKLLRMWNLSTCQCNGNPLSDAAGTTKETSL